MQPPPSEYFIHTLYPQQWRRSCTLGVVGAVSYVRCEYLRLGPIRYIVSNTDEDLQLYYKTIYHSTSSSSSSSSGCSRPLWPFRHTFNLPSVSIWFSCPPIRHSSQLFHLRLDYIFLSDSRSSAASFPCEIILQQYNRNGIWVLGFYAPVELVWLVR